MSENLSYYIFQMKLDRVLITYVKLLTYILIVLRVDILLSKGFESFYV